MLPKIFLFFLVDTQTGNCYYVDTNGNTQKASIQLGSNIDLSLSSSPDGWLNTELSFIRNATYYGINRSFAPPMKFVKDAANIVRNLYYNGRGIETPLTLIILKYNELPQSGEPLYKLYYRGQLDLTKAQDMVAEGFQCNLMEGGVLQLLKTYENVVFEIPCDGSIVENVKANLDGLLLPDTFHYQISFTQPKGNNQTIPCFFLSNDGDNFGIVHSDPQGQGNSETDFINTGTNFIFQSTEAITVRIKGSMTIRPYNSSYFDYPFALHLTGSSYPSKPTKTILSNVNVTQQQIVYFDDTFDLDANEQLYFWSSHNNTIHPMAIVGGNFDISFQSKAQPTSPWCVSAYDLFQLLIKNICQAASTTDQTFNYQATSQLLSDNLNLLITSGDALRASGDANYQKFFSDTQLNPNQPSNNLVSNYGPVIKTSLSDFFKSMSVVLFGALGNQQVPGQRETIFFESMGYVFNPSDTVVDLGEVSNFKVTPATDKIFNELYVGYDSQNYDQKAGKYEYNLKAGYVAPIKTLQKKLELVSKYRADSYGIERLRSNISGTSSTRNDNDNSVFIINVDRTKASLDSQVASFTSLINDVNNAQNTNIRYLANRCANGVSMSTVDGSYLSMNSDPSIFVFAYPGYSASQPLVFSFSGTLQGSPANALTGLAADYIKICLYINGTQVYSRTFDSTSAATAFADSFSVTQNFLQGDCVYATAETSVGGSTTNMNAQIAVGTAGAYWTAVGSSIEVDAGTAEELIAMPNVTAPLVSGLPVVNYGFQYFLFDNILINSTFNIQFLATSVIQQGNGGTLTYRLYKNGAQVRSVSANSNPNSQNPVSLEIDDQETFVLGDVIFVIADSIGAWSQVQSASIAFTSTTITKFALKRIQYDSLTGVPNTLPTTIEAGAPYNIEDLTPKRIFNKWAPWLAACLYGQQTETIYFSTLTKNQYLNTTGNGVTVTENSDVLVHNLGNPLWLPFMFEFDFKVPLTFSDLLTGMANAHIKFTYNGVPFYAFPMEVKQKAALNDKQSGKFICSPATNIQNLINLNYDGLNFINMPPNSIFCPFLSPVQFVPEGNVLPSKYHTPDMNMAWFSEQVMNWVNQNNHWQPYQIGDAIPLQFQTNGLSPVTAYLYNSAGAIVSTVSLTQTTSNAVAAPYYLWIGSIDTTGLPAGSYYIRVNAGGSGGAYMLSDGLLLCTSASDTLLFEYTNSTNKQAMIFDTGFTGAIRVKGFFDNRMKPKYKGAFYTDQPQDISILNAIPYETRELWIGLDDGIPDYVIKKIARVMLLDDVNIEGVGYSLDEGAEWEETFIDGNPKKYWKTTVRLAKNIDGVSSTATGGSGDTAMVVTVDANAFGPNANNAANTADAEIIQIQTS